MCLHRGRVPNRAGIPVQHLAFGSPSQTCTPTMMGSSLPLEALLSIFRLPWVQKDFLTLSLASASTKRGGLSLLHTIEGGDQVLLGDFVFLLARAKASYLPVPLQAKTAVHSLFPSGHGLWCRPRFPFPGDLSGRCSSALSLASVCHITVIVFPTPPPCSPGHPSSQCSLTTLLGGASL